MKNTRSGRRNLLRNVTEIAISSTFAFLIRAAPPDSS